MVQLHEIVAELNSLLNTAEIGDWGGAHNGLQLENEGRVTSIGAAVDSSEAVLAKAVAAGVDLLIVHHGLLWTPSAYTGAMYRKLSLAIKHGLAVYSSHLPLDLHPEYGNNVLLCRALGFGDGIPAFSAKGQLVGRKVVTDLTRTELAARLTQVLGTAPHLCPGGPERVQAVGLVTGGAGSEVAQAVAEGVDTFITGEGSHASYQAAEEAGINLFYGGHYRTETFGVKAVAELLGHKHGLPWQFIDHPSGL